MEADDSLYKEVKKLIKLRLENEPLCSNGAIEFLYAKEKTYPVVYKRNGKEGSILVVLNPSNEEVSCKVTVNSGYKAIYSNNGVATINNDTIVVPACSVSVFKWESKFHILLFEFTQRAQRVEFPLWHLSYITYSPCY